MSKRFIIEVYHPNNEQAGDISAFADFNGFSKEINAGLGECIIPLAKEFDYDGAEVKLDNVVKIFVSDKDTEDLNDGRVLLYSGYISLIEPQIDGMTERITIHLLGQYTRFGTDYLKDGATTTLYTDSTDGLTDTPDGDPADIGLITRAVIDRFNAENGKPLFSYNPTTIPLTSTTVHYMFQSKTYRNALDRLSSLAPAGYFFYFDEYDFVHLKPKPTTPTHIFEFGKHFASFRGEKSMETLRNAIIIWNGETDPGTLVYKYYEDATSVAQYGRRTEMHIDPGIADEASADAIAANFLGAMKQPEVKLTVTIFDNNFDDEKGYDIESIQPGDTCRFVGFNNEQLDFVEENMLIRRVDYMTDRVELTIEAVKSGLIDWQNKTSEKVEQEATNGIPASYTT
jgi:hypothetical protein